MKFFVYTQESDSGHHFKMIVVLRMKYAKKGTVQGVSVWFEQFFVKLI